MTAVDSRISEPWVPSPHNTNPKPKQKSELRNCIQSKLYLDLPALPVLWIMLLCSSSGGRSRQTRPFLTSSLTLQGRRVVFLRLAVCQQDWAFPFHCDYNSCFERPSGSNGLDAENHIYCFLRWSFPLYVVAVWCFRIFHALPSYHRAH